jgi:hypothetical protein
MGASSVLVYCLSHQNVGALFDLAAGHVELLPGPDCRVPLSSEDSEDSFISIQMLLGHWQHRYVQESCGVGKDFPQTSDLPPVPHDNITAYFAKGNCNESSHKVNAVGKVSPMAPEEGFKYIESIKSETRRL